MKTVREMFVSLTAMLINHIWASIIEICVEKWRTQSLKKLKFKCPDMRNGIDLRRCPLLMLQILTAVLISLYFTFAGLLSFRLHIVLDLNPATIISV